MATFPSLTEETSLAAGDFLVGYLAAGAPGDDRRWSAATLAQGLSQLNTPTWNDAGTVFRANVTNVTDTASAAGSKLLDLQVGGVSKFSVDAAGTANIGSAVNSYDLTVGNVTNSLGIAVKNFGFIKAIVGPYHTTYNSSYLLRWGSSTTASNSADLILGRDAAGTLAQRDGVNAQTYNIYNTYTDATNYERAHIGWNDTADTFVIGTEAGSGGGLVRPVEVAAPYLTLKQGADANQYTQSGFKMYGFDDASDRYLQIGVMSNWRGLLYSSVGYVHTSSLLPMAPRTGSLGGDSNIWGEVWGAEVNIDQGPITDDAPALDITSTWNDAADTFTLVKADVTNTASAADSKLLDLQVGGASKFGVDATGEVFGSGVNSRLRLTDSVGAELEYSNWRIGIGGPTAYFYQTTIAKVGMGADGLRLADSGALQWSSGSQASTGHDLFLNRDAANTLAQRNGVNAQTSNIYNTDDGAGNAEWLSLGFSSDDATIQVAKSGTGVARPLFLRGQTLFLGGAAGSNHWKISTAGHFLTQADNTYDIGAASANRPRNGYFSGTIAATGTVKTTPTTVGALPAAATAGAGARTFVTDSANSLSSHHGQIVAGGGANFSPVYSDGTNWLVG